MSFRKQSLGLAALLALSTFALAAQAGPLVRKPKVGEELKYRIKVNVDFGGQDIVFSGLQTEKITEVGTDGTYTVESRRSDIKVMVGGQEMEGAGSEAETATTSVYNLDGTIKEIRGDQADGSAYRFSNLLSVFLNGKEAKVGDTWSNEKAGDTKTGAAGYKSTYKIVGEEKIGSSDTWKVEFSTKESEGDAPATADGTVWLDKAEATMVKMESKWTNAPIPGAPGPVNGSVSITRE
jgi:hypothetical protein